MNWRNPVHILASGFGSGLAPRAPGTFGTIAALPVVLLAQFLPVWWYVGVTALMFVAGIFICGRAARDWGVSDHPAIVWDEFVGLLVTMSAAPVGVVWLLAGFVLFRLFDIAKPWPISSLDRRVHGGFGIMLDDVVAGLFAAVILTLGVRWLS
jgi:phosphatidylglycerophosphatase A